MIKDEIIGAWDMSFGHVENSKTNFDVIKKKLGHQL
jgi:hypothetical protein